MFRRFSDNIKRQTPVDLKCAKDDSDWVESTDNDSVMSDDGESGMEF